MGRRRFLAAVLSAALLALAAAGAEAHGISDFFNIFRPRNEHDYFRNANQGQQNAEEHVVPRASDQSSLAAAPVSRSGLMKVPARSAPTAAGQDTITIPVDDHTAGNPGAWSVITENAGVSAMHLVIMRNDRAIMFDTVTTGPSLLRLPKGNCRLDLRSKQQGAQDCAAHAVDFDYATGGVRALKVGVAGGAFPAVFDSEDNVTVRDDDDHSPLGPCCMHADLNRRVVLVGRARRRRQPRADRRLLRGREGGAVPEPVRQLRLEGVPGEPGRRKMVTNAHSSSYTGST
jgi:hypothetical protein